MRKIMMLCVGLFAVIALNTSCNRGDSSKEVANKWLTAFYHLDYDAAKALSTEDTKNLIAQLQQFSSMIPDSNKKEMKNIVVKIKDVKETGDKAVATYSISDGQAKEQTVNLVKLNGKWLVQFSKNDQMGGDANAPAGDQQQPSGPDSSGAAPQGNSSGDSVMQH